MKPNLYIKPNMLKFTTTVFFKALFLATIITVLAGFALGYKFIEVLTGSMGPTIPAGSIIVIKDMPYDSIEVGDAVTYVLNDGKTYVTHRVIGYAEGTGYLLTTHEQSFLQHGPQGVIKQEDYHKYNIDAVAPIPPNRVVGVVVMSFPELASTFKWIEANVYYIVAGLILILFVVNFA